LRRKELVSSFSHRLEWVEVIGENGQAKVAYTDKLNDPSLAKLDSKEDIVDPKEGIAIADWIKVDGQWYRSMRRP
jgi:hypothetical protein